MQKETSLRGDEHRVKGLTRLLRCSCPTPFGPKERTDSWRCAHMVCCPDAPCSDERPCLHLAFLTSREATVLRACLIRALNASQPDTRREVLQVPDPSDPSGGGFRQHRWTTTQMSRQVASAVIGEASLTEVEVRWGFASEGGLGTKLHAAWEELTCGSQPREQEIAVCRTRAVVIRGPPRC